LKNHRKCSTDIFVPHYSQRTAAFYLAEVTRREQIGLKKGLEEEEEAEAQAEKGVRRDEERAGEAKGEVEEEEAPRQPNP
jgi:hypothetical protein